MGKPFVTFECFVKKHMHSTHFKACKDGERCVLMCGVCGESVSSKLKFERFLEIVDTLSRRWEVNIDVEYW